MNFAGGFVRGHQFKLGTKALKEWVYRRGVSGVEARQVRNYLEVIGKSVIPRVIGLQVLTHLCLFTAMGRLKEVLEHGALSFTTPWTTSDGFFSGTVLDMLMRFWIEAVGEQLICGIELFAYICIRWPHGHLLHRRYGLIFIDNESSRMTMIKRSSASSTMFLLVSLISLLDAILPSVLGVKGCPQHPTRLTYQVGVTLKLYAECLMQ